jgi:AraC-like DNA-binding protein
MKKRMHPEAIQTLLRRAGNSDLFCDFIDSFPYPIQLYAPDGTLIAANPAFLKEFMIPHPGLIVGKYNILRDPTLAGYGVLGEVHAAFEGKPARVMGISAPVHKLKQWFHIPVEASELFYLDISAFPLKNDQGEMIGVVIIYVTQKKLVDREEIVRAKEYMEAHWREKFNVEEVAKAALMSVAHFERMFKACTGMTPHAYYTRIKINNLKDALLDKNHSIEQAFSACGMHYHGHYAQLFKKETGLTPSEYRRLAQTQTQCADIT